MEKIVTAVAAFRRTTDRRITQAMMILVLMA
jgi:hypothetical protein